MGSQIFSKLLELVTRIFSRNKSLQPNVILRELYNELEDKKRVGISGSAFVPNNFVVYLSQTDMEDLAPLLRDISEQLRTRLQERIKRNGYRILAPVTVKIKVGAGLDMNCMDIESCFQSSGSGDGNSATVSPADTQTGIVDDGNTRIAEEQKTQFLDTTKLELEIVEGENIGEIIPLRAGIHTFGRGRMATLQLCDENQTVSRMHFEIEVASGKARIKDLESLNGTKVNAVKVSAPAELTSGDLITAGNVVLKVV